MSNPDIGSSPEQAERPAVQVYKKLVKVGTDLADIKALMEQAGTNEAEREMVQGALQEVSSLTSRYMNK